MKPLFPSLPVRSLAGSIVLPACLAFALQLSAQPNPPEPGAADSQPSNAGAPGTDPSNANAALSGPAGGLFESATFLELADRVFDPESDSLDFENGSFNWKGKTFTLTESRMFRARFERFLLSDPSEDEAEYAALINEILDRLSVRAFNSEEELYATWDLLFQASRFDADAGNSLIVANQVFNAWRVQKENRGLQLTQQELRAQRKYQQEIVANRTLITRKLEEQAARASAFAREQQRIESVTGGQNQGGQNQGGQGQQGQGRGPNGQPGEGTSPGSPLGGGNTAASEAAFRALDLVETETQIAALEVQAATTATQAKLQFQSQIVTFILQRRFQHAMMLSGFYRMIFKGSHQQLEVGASTIAEFFPESDLSYTVDTMEFLAREAVNDVRAGVKAVETAMDENNKLMALERLQETFFLGEYLTPLTGFPSEDRRQLLALYRKLIEAGELADSQDYDAVEELAQELDETTDDFPANQIFAAIERARAASDMAVFAAAQYRNLGDIDRARIELEKAVMLWPSNPSLREFRDETNRLTLASARGEQVFRDLFDRGDWRSIYERRNELGLALAENEELRPELEEVVGRVAQIDIAIAQSREMLRGDNAYAAWELLESAAELDSDDAQLNKARAELAPRVANFAQALDSAKRRSESGEHAAALVAYLQARDVYPASSLSRRGIEREGELILDGLAESSEALVDESVDAVEEAASPVGE